MIPPSALNGPRKLTILLFLLWLHQVDVRFPASIPLGAWDLISRLLRYQPSERLPLAQVLKHLWVWTHSWRVLPPAAQMASLALLHIYDRTPVYILKSQQKEESK